MDPSSLGFLSVVATLSYLSSNDKTKAAGALSLRRGAVFMVAGRSRAGLSRAHPGCCWAGRNVRFPSQWRFQSKL